MKKVYMFLLVILFFLLSVGVVMGIYNNTISQENSCETCVNEPCPCLIK
jgi:hypothetical protein